MSEITTQDKNVIIARFEGRKWLGKYTIDNYGPGTHMEYPELKYHSDWSWLIPVFHKVREIAFELRENQKSNQLYFRLNDQVLYGTIHDVHFHIYQYIEWYQKQKEQQP